MLAYVPIAILAALAMALAALAMADPRVLLAAPLVASALVAAAALVVAARHRGAADAPHDIDLDALNSQLSGLLTETARALARAEPKGAALDAAEPIRAARADESDPRARRTA